MKRTIKWLLEGERFIEYRTRVDLLGQSENDPEAISARSIIGLNILVSYLFK